MFRKLLTVVLSIMMSATLFAGCTLIEKDQAGIDAQAVAVIDPITFVTENGEYTSERIVITRQDLKNFFIAQNAGQYLAQGVSAKEVLDVYAPSMLSTQLILLEGKRMFAAGEMKSYQIRDEADGTQKEAPYSQKQYNSAWQSVYTALDNEIFTLMTEAADDYHFDKPTKVENGDKDAQAQWPVRDTVTEDGEEYEEPWTPVSIYTSENDSKLHLHATRQLLGQLIDELTANPKLLTEQEKAQLKEDRARYDKLKVKPITDPEVVDLYKNLRTYHCVQIKYFRDYEDNLMYESIQNAVTGKFVTQSEFDELAEGKTDEERQKLEESYTIITSAEVTARYNALLATQKSSYTSESAYASAVKADSETILYRPYDVNYYYVKHILVPFSDEQKASFADGSESTSGLQDFQIKEMRNNLAKSITSYEHVNGFDYGDALSIDKIRADINNTMKSAGGSLFAANRAFDDLIYKYNTDPGIVSKTRGYPMQYDEDADYSASPNGMVEEFEEASAEAYAAYLESPATQYGKVYECVSDYGVHFVMVSDVLETMPSVANINDYTSAAETQTIYEKLEAELLTGMQTNYFQTYVSSIRAELNTKYKSSIHLYESVYADLAKELQAQYS